MQQFLHCACVTLFLFCGTALASLSPLLVEKADKAFQGRGVSAENVDQALSLYRQMLPDLRGNRLIEVTARIAWLSHFKADVYMQPASKKYKEEAFALFDACLKDIERISPSSLNGIKRIEYYFWKAACMVPYLQHHSNPFSAAPQFPSLLTTLQKAIQKPDYMQGSPLRLQAAILGLSPTYPVFYQPNNALIAIHKAIEQGPAVYFSYTIKAMILYNQGEQKGAKEVVEAAIASLKSARDSNTLNPLSAPENLFELKRLETLASLLLESEEITWDILQRAIPR